MSRRAFADPICSLNLLSASRRWISFYRVQEETCFRILRIEPYGLRDFRQRFRQVPHECASGVRQQTLDLPVALQQRASLFDPGMNPAVLGIDTQCGFEQLD